MAHDYLFIGYTYEGTEISVEETEKNKFAVIIDGCEDCYYHDPNRAVAHAENIIRMSKQLVTAGSED